MSLALASAARLLTRTRMPPRPPGGSPGAQLVTHEGFSSFLSTSGPLPLASPTPTWGLTPRPWHPSPSFTCKRELVAASSLFPPPPSANSLASRCTVSPATRAVAAARTFGAASSGRATGRSPTGSWLEKASANAPGVVLAVGVALGGMGVAEGAGRVLHVMQEVGAHTGSPFSGVPFAILLGVVVNNLPGLKLPGSCRPGLKLCTTLALRTGIVCLGFKLSLLEVAQLGLSGIPAVLASVGTGVLAIPLASRVLGLTPNLGALLGAGTGICGVTAITAIAPAIAATEAEVAMAVANVVALGTFGMLVFPHLARHTFDTSEQVGLFLGLAIHDTAQVMGSALTYKELFDDEVVLKVAAITKLTRNTLLAIAIPGFAWAYGPAASAAPTGAGGTLSLLKNVQKSVPGFVLGFLLMAAARTVGDASLTSHAVGTTETVDGKAPSSSQSDSTDSPPAKVLGFLDKTQWEWATSTVGGTMPNYCLGTAMAAVGLSTSASVFKGVGPRPFVAGALGAVMVGTVAAASAFTLGARIHLK